MKKILVINDGSQDAAHAAQLALSIAEKVNGSLILANLMAKKTEVKVVTYVTADEGLHVVKDDLPAAPLKSRLVSIIEDKGSLYKPEIAELDASELSINDLVNFINRNEIWMMVKSMALTGKAHEAYLAANIQSVLNRVMCPLLLAPEKCTLKDFERMVYMADLRYCQLPVVKYVARMAEAFGADMQLAHVAVKGLPDMDESYAQNVFRDTVAATARYNKLFFNNIRERNLEKVLDVLTQSMRCDMLVLVNHQYHFETLVGRSIVNTLPDYISVPVLVFPF